MAKTKNCKFLAYHFWEILCIFVGFLKERNWRVGSVMLYYVAREGRTGAPADGDTLGSCNELRPLIIWHLTEIPLLPSGIHSSQYDPCYRLVSSQQCVYLSTFSVRMIHPLAESSRLVCMVIDLSIKSTTDWFFPLAVLISGRTQFLVLQCSGVRGSLIVSDIPLQQ